MKSDIPGLLITIYRINFAVLPFLLFGTFLMPHIAGIWAFVITAGLFHVVLSGYLLFVPRARELRQVFVLAVTSIVAPVVFLFAVPAAVAGAIIAVVLYPFNIAELYASVVQQLRKKQVLGCAEHRDGATAAYAKPPQVRTTEKVFAATFVTIAAAGMCYCAFLRLAQELTAGEMRYMHALNANAVSAAKAKAKTETDIEFMENPNRVP